MTNWIQKIPSFGWVLIIFAGIALFVGAIMGVFYAVTHIEGVGSMILLLGACGALRVGAHTPELKSSSIGTAIFIFFFVTMGVALDQTGNFIYNQPMEWIFCPADSELTRDVLHRAARRGVSVDQNFACAAKGGGQVLRSISGWEQFFFRVFEYVLLGYVLLYLSRGYSKIKGLRQPKKG